MNRRLALSQLLFTLAFALVCAPAGAQTTALRYVLRISGDTAFSYPSSSRLTLTDLRTGKRRSVRTPAGLVDGDISARVNSKTLAAVSGWGTGKLQLWIAGTQVKARVLAEISRPDDVLCRAFDRIDALQIDTKNVVTALFTGYTTEGANCTLNPASTKIVKYSPDGAAREVALPESIRAQLPGNENEIALRGENLFIPPNPRAGGNATIFNLKSGITTWQGSLPLSFGYSLPASNLIASSMPYFGHTSRVYLFNFRSQALTTLTIPHPRPGMVCGDLWVFTGQHRVEVYNFRGRRLLTRKLKSPGYYGGYPVCSGNWVYLPRTRQLSTNKATELRAELIDISRLH